MGQEAEYANYLHYLYIEGYSDDDPFFLPSNAAQAVRALEQSPNNAEVLVQDGTRLFKVKLQNTAAGWRVSAHSNDTGEWLLVPLWTPDGTMEGLSLGESAVDVTKRFGPPASRKPFWAYPQLGVHVDINEQDKVMQLEFEKGETRRGLRIGDSIDRLSELYPHATVVDLVGKGFVTGVLMRMEVWFDRTTRKITRILVI